mgnify:CR=1 FL=1
MWLVRIVFAGLAALVFQDVDACSLIRVYARTRDEEIGCPCCGVLPRRVHPYHVWTVADVPIDGGGVVKQGPCPPAARSGRGWRTRVPTCAIGWHTPSGSRGRERHRSRRRPGRGSRRSGRARTRGSEQACPRCIQRRPRRCPRGVIDATMWRAQHASRPSTSEGSLVDPLGEGRTSRRMSSRLAP